MTTPVRTVWTCDGSVPSLETIFGIYADLVNTVGTFETLGAVILLLIWL
ncbi:hypothetical protein [Natrinema sp. CBA1119]|nr:hypothetical protein [Natrinema sp. CBA1119]